MTNKVKYIVTDPCYLIPDDKWQEICSKCFDNKPDQYDRFNAEVAKVLTEITGHPAYASGTGYGDWSNKIGCEKEGVILKSEFFADSGMVSVCRLTDEIINESRKHGCAYDCGAAIFEAGENISVSFDGKDRGWTVVYIEDKENNIYLSSIEDMPGYEEDDYEEDEEEW